LAGRKLKLLRNEHAREERGNRGNGYLVRSGVTSKDPQVMAAVLAEHAAGTSRSTIGRRLAIHHQTVGRILDGAQGLTG
jgi:hypothetical protein